MTKHYLLMGAGFSKNWGGWLAAEAFEYLLGLPDLQARPAIINLLWNHQRTGGFEGALAELQDQARRSKAAHDKAALAALQQAVRQMFNDMNAAFLRDGFDIGHDTRTFLLNFDAIFSLNQDILLERHYQIGMFPPGGGTKRWNGAYLPGVTPPYQLGEWETQRWQQERWRVLPETPTTLEKYSQPIIKLHGSSQWYRDQDQAGVLVMGGQKSGTIAADPLLRWYRDVFAQALQEPGTRLMIVGYGFRDDHINGAIREGGKKGLKVFNISPDGADAWKDVPNGGIGTIPGKENYLQPMLIGASRRGLLEIVDRCQAENGKVMRFFQP